MLEHTARVESRRVTAEPRFIVQNGINSDSVTLELDGEWSAMERISLVMSKGGAATSYVWEGEPVPMPRQLLADEGPLYLTVVGRVGDDVRVVTERMAYPMQVVASGALTGQPLPDDPGVDEIQQAVDDANEAADRANAAAERAEQLPSISCGDGAPAVGGVRGDLYVDYTGGSLYEFEEKG